MTSQSAEGEANELFAEEAVFRQLRNLRNRGCQGLADSFRRRIQQEKEWGPPRDTLGNPIPRPSPSGEAALAAACLILASRLDHLQSLIELPKSFDEFYEKRQDVAQVLELLSREETKKLLEALEGLSGSRRNR